MKRTAWLFTALIPWAAISVLAQPSNTVPPSVPTPPPPVVTTVPDSSNPAPGANTAEKPSKPKARHKKAAKATRATPKAAAKAAGKPAPGKTNEVTVLNPPVAASVKCNVLDVRGQAGFAGEIITYLKKGESVSVLEEIHLAHTKSGEPAHWSKIVMPANTAVWVDGQFVDSESKTVKARKLNVRGGPGENYSVIGRLEKGDSFTQIGKKEGWVEIAAPTNAYAFVASEYLEAGPAVSTPETVTAPTPPPQPAPPPPQPPVVVNVPPSEPTPAPAPTVASSTPTPSPSPSPTPAPAPEPAVTAPAPTVTQPEPGKEEVPRIVTREGYVRRCFNIQGPADFELRDIKTGELTEYVQAAPSLKFKKFVGTRVRITGSESLDARWPRTPVMQVQTVDLMP